MTLFLIILAFLLHTGKGPSVGSGEPPLLSFEEFEPYLHKSNDTTYVINFWATWCKPCVEELPYFEELHRAYQNQPVRVVLVSLDFKHQIETKLLPFLEKHNVESEVVVLYAPNANAWIDKVDSRWSGAIPATVVYRNDDQLFHGEKFNSYRDLELLVESLLKI